MSRENPQQCWQRGWWQGMVLTWHVGGDTNSVCTPLPAAGWHSVCVGACTSAEVNVCAVTGRPRVPARMWKGMHVHVCVTASVPLACFPTCTRREGLYSLEGPSSWAHPKCSAWLRPLPLPTNRLSFRGKREGDSWGLQRTNIAGAHAPPRR